MQRKQARCIAVPPQSLCVIRTVAVAKVRLFFLYASPRALTWRQDIGYGHHKVDDGENRPGKPKAAAILLPDGPFDRQGIGEAFAHASAHMDPAIAQFVWHKIMAYAGPTPSQ